MKAIYFTLGAIIPLPVFVNLLTREVLIQRASLDNYLTSFGIPVPVGLFSVLLMGIIAFGSQLLKLRSLEYINVRLGGAIVTTVVFAFYALFFLEITRVLSLILPAFVLIFVYLYLRSNALLHYSMQGYVFSMFALVLAHAFSIILFGGGGDQNNILLFSSFYGYFIYQALVSYSAVLSFLGCTMLVLFVMPASHKKKIQYFVTVVVVFFVLSYGMRKAVIFDVFMLFCAFGFFGVLSLAMRQSIPDSYLRAYGFIVLLAIYLLFLSGFVERDLSIDSAIATRQSDYVKFLDMLMNATLADMLIGFGVGWGGAHNIFVIMIMSLGFIGLMLFIGSLYLMFRVVGRQLQFNYFRGYSVNNGRNERSVWGVFLILSVIGANSFNSNFQLPYYVLNVVFISLSYLRESRLQRL